MKQDTLGQRMAARGFEPDGIFSDAVRAELTRLARQIRNIRKEVLAKDDLVSGGYRTALGDMLNLITQAKR